MRNESLDVSEEVGGGGGGIRAGGQAGGGQAGGPVSRDAPGGHGGELERGVGDGGFVRGVCLPWGGLVGVDAGVAGGLGGGVGGGGSDRIEGVQLRVGHDAAEAHDRVGFGVEARHLCPSTPC